MYSGTNRDGYFTNDQLALQTVHMLEIFNILHANCEALVDIDNSANHHAMSSNALVGNRLNLNDGEKMFVKPGAGGSFDQTEVWSYIQWFMNRESQRAF